MNPFLFVTATGTGVGKTFVSCSLAEGLRRDGTTVEVFKPFSAGDMNDARALHRACGRTYPLVDVTLAHCPHPVAPGAQWGLGSMGARRVERVFASARAVVRRARRRSGATLIEGAGGALVPLGGPYVLADLIVELGAPVWIVALAGLGTLNHTLLTVEALRRRNVLIKRILLNKARGADPAERSNPRLLNRLTGLPVTVVPLARSSSEIGRVRQRLWGAYRRDFTGRKRTP